MGKNLKGKNIGRGICQRKDGIYQAKIYLKMTPKPIYIYDSNLNSLRVKKKRFEQQKLNNFFTTQSLLTVNDWFDHWMETVCAVKLKNTTIQNYYNNYNRIKGSIQNIKLIELTQSHIQMAINEISKKYKPSTVKSSLNALSACLEYAEKNMIIVNNPCKCIVISNYTDRSFVPIEQEDEMKYITKDMLDLFFEAAKNCRSRYYFYILLHTGLRAGELCALQWKDVDFDKKELHVYKTINKTRCYFDIHGEKLEKSIASVQITMPKRNASNRIVPLTDGVIEAFLKLKEIQENDKNGNIKWGSENEFRKTYPDLVLTTKDGNYFLPNYVEQECKRIVKKINTKGKALAKEKNRAYEPIRICPHMFRHTFITNCYQQKIDTRILTDIVGHTNSKMTNHYTHPECEFMHREFKKYEDLL